MRKKPDAMTLVGLAVLLIFAAGIFRNSTTRVAADAVPETPNPVSYTHLDVYKRQALHHRCTLATRNESDFRFMGVALVNPWQ